MAAGVKMKAEASPLPLSSQLPFDRQLKQEPEEAKVQLIDIYLGWQGAICIVQHYWYILCKKKCSRGINIREFSGVANIRE